MPVQKHKHYSKPPITEAVIELRFADSLSDKELEKRTSKQKSGFHVKPIQEMQFKFSPASDLIPEKKSRLAGFQLISNENNSDILLVKQDSFAVSRLPPYENWDHLVQKLKSNLNWYKSKTFRPLSRIGVRYINRIDIPSSKHSFNGEDYFELLPKI